MTAVLHNFGRYIVWAGSFVVFEPTHCDGVTLRSGMLGNWGSRSKKVGS